MDVGTGGASKTMMGDGRRWAMLSDAGHGGPGAWLPPPCGCCLTCHRARTGSFAMLDRPPQRRVSKAHPSPADRPPHPPPSLTDGDGAARRHAGLLPPATGAPPQPKPRAPRLALPGGGGPAEQKALTVGCFTTSFHFSSPSLGIFLTEGPDKAAS